MSEKLRFIEDLETPLFTMTEQCKQYGISRKTSYKWAARYAEDGPEGLEDHSRAPKHPRRTERHVAEALIELRKTHPSWGPRKLRPCSQEANPPSPYRRPARPARSSSGPALSSRGVGAEVASIQAARRSR